MKINENSTEKFQPSRARPSFPPKRKIYLNTAMQAEQLPREGNKRVQAITTSTLELAIITVTVFTIVFAIGVLRYRRNVRPTWVRFLKQRH